MNISKVSKKTGLALGLLLTTAIILVACGGGGGGGGGGGSDCTSSVSDDTGGKTLVTAVPGSSNAICGKNVQCVDYIFALVAKMPSTISQLSTPWTNTCTNIIYDSKIAFVDGSNDATVYAAAGSVFAMTTNPLLHITGFAGQGTRAFVGNGLPTTKMGTFPVQAGTAAYPYYAALPGGSNPAGTSVATGNPEYVNAAAIGISPYPFEGVVPLNPVISGAYPINSLISGFALTGAPWHIEKANDSSGNYYSPINALPNDACYGHPYNQQYHYHAYSWKCFPNQGTTGQSPVFGFALDGFPITGPRGADGNELTNADLDECHGTTSVLDIPDGAGGFVTKLTYHYVLNREYPYSVGCFRGKVNYKAALGGAGDVPIVINGQTFYTNNYMKEGFAYPDSAQP
ncbi:YHYH protein [Polynucleobacter sp. JS-Fieb-80-E5]|uniref:YHYH protein n=1 Tax=Polynucleobacter sp. JS-Fieb-80-E5 TaxID=2081050 RepID=UPI001C0C7649|nr:YHYH protein [Polynucleobacter sp. JS-Fieb-80-E5]MBU3618562.1 YHYH protein [Polynucleobacter sp. JS-Fieb-80-E5]